MKNPLVLLHKEKPHVLSLEFIYLYFFKDYNEPRANEGIVLDSLEERIECVEE